MATYVNDLRLKEIATGDEAGTWGTSTNTNLELIAEAFSFGTEAITTNANTHTTTIADGSTDPGRSIFLKYTGALDSDCTITIGPNTVSKLWLIENATTDSGSSGPYNIIIKQGTGATVTIPNSHTKAIYSDGAGSGGAMVEAFTDLNLTDTVTISGSTPTLTIGDAGAEDTKIVFDGNAQDFYIGLDDSADDLVIGKGSAVGTTPAIEIDENLDIKFAESIGVGQAASSTTGDIVAQTMSLKGTTPTLTIGDAGAEDTKIVFDGNAQDYYIGLDDSADDLLIGLGSSVGTTPAVIIDENLKVGIGAAPTLGALHVTSSLTDTVTIENTDSGTTGAQLILFHNSSSPADGDRVGALNFKGDDDAGNDHTYAGIRCLATDVSNTTEDGTLTFSTSQAGTFTEQLRLSNLGNLHLSGGSDRRIQLGSGGDGANTVSNNTVHIRGETNDMKFMVASGGQYLFEQNGTERARINSDGKLLVQEIAHLSSGNLEIGNGDEKQIFDASGETIQFQTGDTERMRIAGDVRIGTTTQGPATALTVSGTSSGGNGAASITGSADNGPALNCIKTSTTTDSSARFIQFGANSNSTPMGGIGGNGASNVQFITLSDEREKENITPVVSVLDKVMNLNVVSFDWIKHDEHIKAGFIAQNVEKYFPEYVVENVSNEGEEERKGTTGGMSAGYIAVLTKAIQEQQEQILSLQQKIEVLENVN